MGVSKKNRLRCFFAIQWLPDPELRNFMKSLAIYQAGLRIVPVRNLHVTLHFPGGIEILALEELILKIRQLGECYSALQLQSTQIFGLSHSIVLGVQPVSGLLELASDIEKTSRSVLSQRRTSSGTGRAAHADNSHRAIYTPHITLARIRKDARLKLTEIFEAGKHLACGQSTADSFHLYKSEPTPEGSEYTILETFALGQARGEIT